MEKRKVLFDFYEESEYCDKLLELHEKQTKVEIRFDDLNDDAKQRIFKLSGYQDFNAFVKDNDNSIAEMQLEDPEGYPLSVEEVWDDFKNNLMYSCKDFVFEVIADIHTWNSQYTGSKIFYSIEDVFRSTLQDAGNFEIQTDDNNLFIVNYHHDGTNTYKINIVELEDTDELSDYDYKKVIKRDKFFDVVDGSYIL